jgi:phage terminase large subunit-like protein
LTNPRSSKARPSPPSEDDGSSPNSDLLREAARKANSTEQYRKKFWAIDHVAPYPKQVELFALGATMRERLFKAANQCGKSYAAAIEASYHLTGRYPAWWKGHRFAKAISAWVTSETTTLLRDVFQKLLFGAAGDAEAFGTGTVPLDLIGKVTMTTGIRDAYDTVRVRHVSGGWSTVQFRSYQAGREAFQGVTLDFIVCDEEPPADVYGEAITRISATDGRALIVYTPMGGPGEVTRRFTQDASPDRAVVKMSLYDICDLPGSHMTRERVEVIKRNCPPHEVRTRIYGEDMLGEGSVFPIDEDIITEPPILNIPPHWFKIWGIDFGINHAFAAVLLLYDAEADVIHVHHCIRLKGQTPLQHAVPMKAIGADVVVAYPKDGDNREMGTGDPLANLYRGQDLRMMPSHATWPDGTISTERGILEMWQRMTTGRLKVANTLMIWFEEFRGYHRKNNQIVKLFDDLMSSTRVGVMALRHAKQGPLGSKRPPRQSNLELNTGEAIRQRGGFDVFNPGSDDMFGP